MKKLNIIKDKKKEILLFFIVLITSVLVTAISLEIYLGKEYENYHKEMNTKCIAQEFCNIYSEYPELIYEFKPDTAGANSKGYFDFEYSYKKDKNVFRIVLIGDSVAQGLGVNPFKQSFGKLLEKKLNENSEKKFEVIVLARAGYSMSQEMVLLKKEAFLYEPDLILWSYVLNDLMHPLYHDADNKAGKYFFKPDSHFLFFVSEKLFLIKEQILAVNCKKETYELLHCVYWNDFQKNIQEIKKTSEKENTPVIFLIHPLLKGNSFKNYSLTLVHEKIEAEAEKNSIKAIDLLEAFNELDVKEVKQNIAGTPEDLWHPNIKGHEITANFIYEKLVEYDYVSK